MGKTISDYKTMTASGIKNGVASVTKMHMISTDGETVKSTSHCSVVTNGEISKVSITGIDGKHSVSDIQVKEGAKEMEVYVNGKKSSTTDLGAILPEKIASMTVYRAGKRQNTPTTKKRTSSSWN